MILYFHVWVSLGDSTKKSSLMTSSELLQSPSYRHLVWDRDWKWFHGKKSSSKLHSSNAHAPNAPKHPCVTSVFIPVTWDSSRFSWLLLSAHIRMGTQNHTPVVTWKQLLISYRLDVDILNCLLAAVAEFWRVLHEGEGGSFGCPALLGLFAFQSKNLLFTLRYLFCETWTSLVVTCNTWKCSVLLKTSTLLVLEKKCSILVPFLICIIAPCNRAKTSTGLGWWLKGH